MEREGEICSMAGETDGVGVVLFAHGSSVEAANRGVRELAERVVAAGPFRFVRAAFLEQAQPDLGAAVAEANQAGLRQVIVIPYFLTQGLHLRRDLPRLVSAERVKFPGLDIRVGQSLEDHPLMASIIVGRVRETLEGNKPET